jgi:hypothetical protein
MYILIFLITFLSYFPAAFAGTPENLQMTASSFEEEAPQARGFLENSERVRAPLAWRESVLTDAQQLRSRGLPAAPFLLKASEGLVKRIRPEKIDPTLQQTKEQTEQAENLVTKIIPNSPTTSIVERRRGISVVQRALVSQFSPEHILTLAPPVGRPHPTFGRMIDAIFMLIRAPYQAVGREQVLEKARTWLWVPTAVPLRIEEGDEKYWKQISPGQQKHKRGRPWRDDFIPPGHHFEKGHGKEDKGHWKENKGSWKNHKGHWK